MVARPDFLDAGKRITLIPVKPLRTLRGTVTSEVTGGIAAERIQVKHAVAERLAKETE